MPTAREVGPSWSGSHGKCHSLVFVPLSFQCQQPCQPCDKQTVTRRDGERRLPVEFALSPDSSKRAIWDRIHRERLRIVSTGKVYGELHPRVFRMLKYLGSMQAELYRQTGSAKWRRDARKTYKMAVKICDELEIGN